jgi:hypothetical protein
VTSTEPVPYEGPVLDGELLDEDSPGPRPADDTPRRETSRRQIALALARATGLRELAVTRHGATHTARQAAAWWTGRDLDTAYCAAAHLNHQYDTWKARQTAHADTLNEQAKAVEQAKGDDGHHEAWKLKAEAQQIAASAFITVPPGPGSVDAARKRRVRTRRVRTALVVSCAAVASWQTGALLDLGLAATGLTAVTAWVQGRWPTTLHPAPPALRPGIDPAALHPAPATTTPEPADTAAPDPTTPATPPAEPAPATAAPEAQPPAAVTWKPSNDPYVMHIGTEANGVDHYLRTLTDNPHAAYVGGSGSGKTTALTLPLVHARQHGALATVIDLKRMSYTERDAEHPDGIAGDPTRPSGTVSGVRIATTLREAVAALAEFLASATAVALMQQAGQDTSHIPPRLLLIDEYGSFAGAVKAWWKGPGQQKTPNVIPFWMHVCLMQGRALDHRLAVGAHQMALDLFGGSDARDLFSGRLVIGDCSAEKWVTTYGRIKKPTWDGTVKGRGVYGALGATPTVVQVPYLPQAQANAMLRQLPDGPGWFDAGQPAPWITEAHIREIEASYSAGQWVPGWERLFAKKKPGPDADALAEELLDEIDQHYGTTDEPTPSRSGPDWLPDAIRSIHAAGPAGMKPGAVAEAVGRDRKAVRSGLRPAVDRGALIYRDNGPHSAYVHPDHT